MTENPGDTELQEIGGISAEDHDHETREGPSTSPSSAERCHIITWPRHAGFEPPAQDNSPGVSRHVDTSPNRWIHIPFNDIDIAKKLVYDCMRSEPHSTHMEATWKRKLRPLHSIPESIIPIHAWCMEPSIQVCPEKQESGKQESGKQKSGITIFFPYLNWENYGTMEQDRKKPDARKRRHLRRTLDEFYYSGLRETASRNAGQTVSKWTGNEVPEDGRSQAVKDSRLVLVDQLWLWTLDDSTIVSCFPTEDLTREDPSDVDIMASVGTDINKCKDTIDLLAYLIRRSVTQMLEGSSQSGADILSIYRWAAANKAARHSELLERFWRSQSGSSLEAQTHEESEELNLTLEVVDLLDELNILMLLFETQASVLNDIRRQLAWIKPRAKKEPQESRRVNQIRIHDSDVGSVRVSMEQNVGPDVYIMNSTLRYIDIVRGNVDAGSQLVGGHAGEWLEQAVHRLQLEASNTERLHREVSQTHKLLLELLDLEQKAASLGEARITTKQGQAIMLFTIITIIFLPLSFFTSYFGQNVSELTGDTQNPKSGELWKIAAPISVIVILIALAISFFIVYPWKTGKELFYGVKTSFLRRISTRRSERLAEARADV